MHQDRLKFATTTAREAGAIAEDFFQNIAGLHIEEKGLQDLVSNADRDVEIFIRKQITDHYPSDGIVGEEFENIPSQSGYIWVIDPIDGTTNFLSAIPDWCVVLACVNRDHTEIGVIFVPAQKAMFTAIRNGGSFLNDSRMITSSSQSLAKGSTGVGMSGRTASNLSANFISALVAENGVFYRNASGALMLAYVAAGRLIAYVEPHMNAWDCLAGQLMIAEAGGVIEKQNAVDMLENGGRVVAGAKGVFAAVQALADQNFNCNPVTTLPNHKTE